MPIVLFVEKNGSLKEMKLKEVVPEELYRKASFKTAEGFGVQTTWSNPDRYRVSLYARKNGRPGSENKYDFPPPVDNELFFGGCVLTNQDVDGNYIDLTKSMWERIYEELFGGFDDLGSEDSESESDDLEDKEVPRTKEGYAKDGFIVDDAEEVESETSEESDSDSSDVELEGEEGDDDIDTDDLCEDDDDGEEDVSDSEVEAEDEDEDEEDEGGDFYDSDGDEPKQKKKKPVKKVAPPKSAAKKGGKNVAVVAPAKKRTPASGSGGVGTRSKAAKKVAPEPAENGGGYLNCSDELEEEAYLDDA